MSSLLATNRTQEDPNSQSIATEGDGPDAVESSDTQTQKGSTSSSNWEKRYKDLQAFHDREVTKLKKELTNSKDIVAPTTVEELDKFKREHTQLYNAIRSIAINESKAVTEGVNGEVAELRSTVSRNKKKELVELIVEAHPDFKQIIASEDFQSWVDDQSPKVQSWVRNNPDDADLAIAALDLYKAKAGKEKVKASRNSDAATAIKTGSQPDVSSPDKMWKASDIKKMTPSQYAKLESEIDKAWDEGRIDLNS